MRGTTRAPIFASQTNTSIDAERRAEAILEQMTIEEKIDLLGGAGNDTA